MLNKYSAPGLLTNLVTLFTSSGTLLCCALPALFVSLGAGATLASIVSTFPQLIWISRHKLLMFGVAGLALLISGILRMRPQACPADATLAQACAVSKRYSNVIFAISVLVYLTGAFFAFVLPLFI